MTEIRYTQIKGHRWLASMGDESTEVTFSRERGYPGLFRGEVHGDFYHWAAAAMADVVPGPCKILDVGCGAGYGARILWGYGHTVTGCDPDTEAVHYARMRYGDYGDFVYGGFEKLPYTDDAADAVVSSDSFEHTTDGTQAASEISRVLKGGGALFLTTPDATKSDGQNPHHPKEYTEEELRKVIVGAGIEVAAVHRFPSWPGHMGLIGVKP